ncbi:DUF6069 family protein [Actinomadura hibisca]|uniref:DUF6069 family protein n=1 Tax=Actinomadura hibisca TaxID=68565 RepID=UPI000835E3AF|nr:DUF6069 family protein [Actinomadura hibisca]
MSATLSTTGIGTSARRGRRALAVAGATVASAVVWAVGEPLLGNDLVVSSPGQDPQDLGAAAFIVMALAFSLLGWGLLAVLERVARRAATIWTVVASLFLLLSFVPLFTVEATGGSKAVLALAHVAVAAVLIPVFRLTAKERP